LIIPISTLFETHLNVTNLDRAVRFYRDVLGLPIAGVYPARRVAFFWIGGAGRGMLGVWEVGSGPQRISLHTAFGVALEDLLAAPGFLRAAAITALDFDGNAASEPVVLAWMPAAAIYFHDPDGNLLEFITMLSDEPAPDLGVLSWSEWRDRHHPENRSTESL
jgi:lactoylglutathione lyase